MNVFFAFEEPFQRVESLLYNKHNRVELKLNGFHAAAPQKEVNLNYTQKSL